MINKNTNLTNISIVWLKKDLRIHDHEPFFEAQKLDLPILPLYVFEPEYWKQPYSSIRQWKFIEQTLVELNQKLTNKDQPLVFKCGNILKVLTDFSNHFNIIHIFAHEETGTMWTYKRDQQVIDWCKKNNIQYHAYPYNGVIRYLKTREHWQKIRTKRLHSSTIPEIVNFKIPLKMKSDSFPTNEYFNHNITNAEQTYLKGGHTYAQKILLNFLSQDYRYYLKYRSKPPSNHQSTSRMSPYLTYGLLSVKEIYRLIQEKLNESYSNKFVEHSLSAFESRLMWRCHFIQKLEDQPNIEIESMHPSFNGFNQTFNKDYFDAWKLGLTGFPLIDASMRYLLKFGWINFRMRAMLSSFAAYNLQINWRVFGNYLAQLFIDFEPGIHFSQIQMQSGVTGINAIRIYNPIKQASEHDPDGVFVKKHVPELSNIPKEWILEPWKMPKEIQKKCNFVPGIDYPHPIVDLQISSKQAKETISNFRKKTGFKETSKKVYKKLGSRKKNNKTKTVNKNQIELNFS